MPCNLAVSIAKAGVTTPQLLALLTPSVIEKVALTYLQQQYASLKPSAYTTYGTTVMLSVGTAMITIEDGTVQVEDSRRNRQLAEQLASEMEQLLLQLADSLFQQKLQETLGSLVKQTQTVSVDNEGAVQQAAVFYLEF